MNLPKLTGWQYVTLFVACLAAVIASVKFAPSTTAALVGIASTAVMGLAQKKEGEQ